MKVIEIRIEGMSCAGCVATVERCLREQVGVGDVSVTLNPGLARVGFDPEQVSEAVLDSIVEGAGFDVVH